MAIRIWALGQIFIPSGKEKNRREKTLGAAVRKSEVLEIYGHSTHPKRFKRHPNV